MTALDQLNAYIRTIARRLRFYAASRGAAAVAVLALFATVVLVFIANRYGFSDRSVWVSRAALFVVLSTMLMWGLVLPWFRLSRREAVKTAEKRFPEFQQRLLTIFEGQEREDLFVELVADDALAVAKANAPEHIVPRRSILGFLISAGVAVALFVWLFLAAPGYLGYGTSLLWAGQTKPGIPKLYDIVVSPGDRTVRRKSNQLIIARILGLKPNQVRLYARLGRASNWEQVAMQPQAHGPAYEFLFGGLAEDVEYYVESGALRSKHFTLHVADLPAVNRIRVTYRFPSWSGLAPLREDPGGNVRAVEGTEANVGVQTDRPLDNGFLVLGDGIRIPLNKSDGSWTTAQVPVEKDGTYHVAAMEQGATVRLSEDYAIEAEKDLPPIVKLVRPARDAKVNPIEEIPIVIEASDDFGLQDLSLHYSVNGGKEQSVPLLSRAGAKDASGKHTIALEDFKLAPGDVVTLYAAARDARNTAYSDVYFIQTEPFERQYTQARSGSAPTGGGGGQDQTDVSGRQKEIIAATWNEIKQGAQESPAARDHAKSLGQLQEKLADQARSVGQRMRARGLLSASIEAQGLANDMEAAAKEMAQAAEKLKNMKWSEALPPAQRALQHALRVEDTLREIQIGPRRASGQGTGRDLASLFDLELDTEKNQYETGQQRASNTQRDKEMEEALKKLKELAKRQQELAQQQTRQPKQQAFRQKWEQELLRREAEELQRRMEQLQSEQQNRGNSQDRRPAPSDARMQQVIDRVKQAAEEMRRSYSAGQPASGGRLQEASDLMSGLRQQQESAKIEDLLHKAEQLSAHENDYQTRMRQMFGNMSDQNSEQTARRAALADAMAAEKEQMAAALKLLEQQIGETARNLATAQSAASTKLDQALSEAQQNELELRMRQGAESIRRGAGLYTAPGQHTIAEGLERLEQHLKDARSGMRSDQNQNAQSAPGSGRTDLDRALAHLETARGRLREINAAQPQTVLRELRNELSKLKEDLEGNKELSGNAQRLMVQLEATSSSHNAALFADRLTREILSGMERLEADLRGRLGSVSAPVRSPAADHVPLGYADAVATYFRKLSAGR